MPCNDTCTCIPECEQGYEYTGVIIKSSDK